MKKPRSSRRTVNSIRMRPFRSRGITFIGCFSLFFSVLFLGLDSTSVLPVVVLTITSVADSFKPALVDLIPLDGFRQAAFPSFQGAPAQLMFDLAWIDGIAA